MAGTALTLVQAEKRLVHYNTAKRELALAKRIDEVKHIRDVAMAAQVYARQAKDRTMLDDATDIRMRAERKAGAILITMRERGELRSKGDVKGGTWAGATSKGVGKGKGHDKGSTRVRADTSLEPPKLSDIGITRVQAGRWRKLADLPEEKFEKAIEHAKASPRRKFETNRQPIHRLGLDLFNFKSKFVKGARAVIEAGDYSDEGRDTLIDILRGVIREFEDLVTNLGS